MNQSRVSKNNTGFFWNERCFWHGAGNFSFLTPIGGLVEPSHSSQLPESPETKRRLKNLIDRTGLSQELDCIDRIHSVSEEELLRVHTTDYIKKFKALSSQNGGDLGLRAPFGPGGYDIACISAGVVRDALFSVIEGTHTNAYALSRPPGHHCLPDFPNGFCLLNNIAIAVEDALCKKKVERVAVVDWDVHHGNGTEAIFYKRSEVLTISVHQERNYPHNTGAANETGTAEAPLSNVNIPLIPGGGHLVYKYAFRKVIIPKLKNFNPDIIIVACGFDASGVDPLSRMLCGSNTFVDLTQMLMELSGGKLVLVHEGGYNELHVPFCGHGVLQKLSGSNNLAQDPLAERITAQQPDPMFDQLQFKKINAIASLHKL